MTTRFQVMSDLHIETMAENVCPTSFMDPKAEVMILAGDIGRILKIAQLTDFLRGVCKQFRIVLYVLGNHEYYQVPGLTSKTMEELRIDLEKVRATIPNLHILDRSSVLIGNVCIAGCTLWSHATVDVPPFIVRIKDMTMKKYNTLHKEDLQYVEGIIEYCRQKKYKLLMVTHHCPTYLVGQTKANDRYKSLYVSNLDYLLSVEKVHTWVCGHIHKNFDLYTKSGTRLLSNQKGKPRDGITDFSLSKVFTV